jgi:hypothetical protein
LLGTEPAYEDRTQLMLRTSRAEARRILEPVQPAQIRRYTELLAQAAARGNVVGLAPARVTADTVGPEARPKRLCGGTTMKQHRLTVSKQENRKRAMQVSITAVCVCLAGETGNRVIRVDEHQQLIVEGDLYGVWFLRRHRVFPQAKNKKAAVRMERRREAK